MDHAYSRICTRAIQLFVYFSPHNVSIIQALMPIVMMECTCFFPILAVHIHVYLPDPLLRDLTSRAIPRHCNEQL